MNILHLYDEHQPVNVGNGSVATVIYRLATTAAKKGHNITVAERRWEGMPPEESICGVQFKRFDLTIGSTTPGEEVPYDEVQSPLGLSRLLLDRLQFSFKLNRYISNENFDIIHVHLPFSANILIHLNRSLRKKMIYTAHIGEEDIRLGLKDKTNQPVLVRYFSPDIHLMSRVAMSTVLNKPIQNQLQKKGISVKYIPNGVDINSFPIDNEIALTIRNKYNIENPLILYSGSITPRKGIDTLVESVDKLSNEGIEANFLIVGDDSIDKEFASAMKKKADQLDGKHNISFTGYIPFEDLKGLYALSDVFVLPSRGEGMPISILEALASGSAIVATDVGGIPMLVNEGENGVLVSPDSPEELASAIESIITDDQEIESMGNKSRQIAVNQFSWDNITDKYIDVYKSIKDSK